MKEMVISQAPINIALCKYWGKKDIKKVLPYTDSISISLDKFYTETSVKRTSNQGFSYTLNGERLKGEALKKVLDFCRLFYDDIINLNVSIASMNTGPTSAGLASSASAYAALAIALNEFFELDYDQETLTTITRKGSGSASRSLLDGFVRWTRKGHVEKLCSAPSNLVMIAVVIDESEKEISSREAMEIGVNTSSYYEQFIVDNQDIADKMTKVLCPFDLQKVGILMEESTALMHRVMETSNPVINYLRPRSIQLKELVKKWRKNGLKAYTTMDAGPNVKILTTVDQLDEVIRHLDAEDYTTYYQLSPGKKARVITSE